MSPAHAATKPPSAGFGSYRRRSTRRQSTRAVKVAEATRLGLYAELYSITSLFVHQRNDGSCIQDGEAPVSLER